MSVPALGEARRDADDWQLGLVPAPGLLLGWTDPRHYGRWRERPCVPCGKPTPMRSHLAEAAYKDLRRSLDQRHPD
ncbi:hypothetical protein [Streptomyces sp. NPDC005345]|uniref:hypothetical protein n=1 Tax=Streptomyces sp. NPDC005345 TaxID=3156877 RepID=UPI0033A881DE